MAPFAAAGYVIIGVALFVATLVGAVAGAAAWAVRARLEWIGALAIVGYLAAAGPLLSINLLAAIELGVPLVILTLLTSWLIARQLELRAHWRSIWASVMAFACSMVAGFAGARLFGLHVPSVALGADVFLIPIALISARSGRR